MFDPLARGPLNRTPAADGTFWQLTPAGLAAFGPAGLPARDWQDEGRLAVVKQNIQRVIGRVTLPGGDVFVKRCRANTPRALAREWLRPPKARLEFDNLLKLRALGVSAVEPLAWGASSRRWPGESWLVTAAQPHAEPLSEYLVRPLPPAARRRLAARFGDCLARLHEAGVTHPDPHPGNVLVDAAAAFYLMDLHAVTFAARPLKWPESRDNLVLWNRWFQPRASAAHRARFWRAYLAARQNLDVPDNAAAELERLTLDSNRRFWTARLARYTQPNRDMARRSAPGVSGMATRDLTESAVAALFADPDALFATRATLMKDSRTSTVAMVDLPTGAGPVAAVAKRFRLKSWQLVVKNLLRPSPALRSWRHGHNLRDRGLPTPRPLLFAERRLGPLRLTGYLVAERVPGAVELPAAVATYATHPDRPRLFRAWATQLGRLVRSMHDRDVSHRDLKAANLLLAGAAGDPFAARFTLIDLVGVEVGKAVPRAVRVRDLARLNASFLPPTPVARGERLRLLRRYLGPGEEWKPWWRDIAAATAAKVAKNRRNRRPLA